MSPLPAAAAEYWSAPAPMTQIPGGPGSPSAEPDALPLAFLAELPSDPIALCRIAEGVIIHEFWAGAYGRELIAGGSARSRSGCSGERGSRLEPGAVSLATSRRA